MNGVDLRHSIEARNFLTPSLIKKVIENFTSTIIMFGVPYILDGENTGVNLNDECIIDSIRNNIAGRKT